MNGERMEASPEGLRYEISRLADALHVCLIVSSYPDPPMSWFSARDHACEAAWNPDWSVEVIKSYAPDLWDRLNGIHATGDPA